MNPTRSPPPAPRSSTRTEPPLSGLTLLRSGREYFPALLAAIAGAQRSIALETYIFANDATGRAVGDALIQAAQRGVKVRVTMDGFGSGDDGRGWVAKLVAHGIDARIYRPQRWWQAGFSPKLLRRVHRKLCVIDAVHSTSRSLPHSNDSAKGGAGNAIGFVGGINVLDDHNHAPHTDLDLGPRFDFAVRLQGPYRADVLGSIHAAMHRKPQKSPTLSSVLSQAVALVLRDNWRNRQTIQRLYLQQLAAAQHSVWIANAYFLPARRLRLALIDCARRGVVVKLLLQGRQEYFLQHHATQALYGQLLAAGIHIYEYRASFLHAKVAVFDGERATVGSSNIDPFSLLLAKEANLWVTDACFAGELETALQTACTEASVQIQTLSQRPLWQRCVDWLAYGVLRLGLMVVFRRDY